MIGRQDELVTFKRLLESQRPELLLVTGRRRVGKTYLIREGFSHQIIFEFVGTKDANTANQLQKFSQVLGNHFPKTAANQKFENWSAALNQLGKCLTQLRKSQKKRVVFFDEFPWIAYHKSNFLHEFEYWWNAWASKQNNLIVVISGSATSWMINNVLNNKDEFYNRVTQRIHLQPFTLFETMQLFKSKGINQGYYQILQLYMVMGGIPHYLEDVAKGESATQTINRMCFTKNGILNNEFHNLYKAIFEHHENHIAVVRALSTKWKGMDRQAIIAATKFTDGGGLSKILDELETCSFIVKMQPMGKKSKDVIYRLIDEFTLFYFNFIENNRSAAKDVWFQKSKLPQYLIWQGYAFENVCIRHHNAIKIALGISGIYTEISSCNYPGSKKEKGLQIDMIIDRSDNAMNLCEMKFYNQAFSVDKAFAETIRKRSATFKTLTHTKKLLLNTLITTYPIESNEHSLSQIDQVITMEKLFELNTFS